MPLALTGGDLLVLLIFIFILLLIFGAPRLR